jgi:hypothetical protein
MFRTSLPKGMSVTWYGGGQQQVSRVKTLSMGGVFLGGSTLRVGSELTLVFEVPGGIVMAEAVDEVNLLLGLAGEQYNKPISPLESRDY